MPCFSVNINYATNIKEGAANTSIQELPWYYLRPKNIYIDLDNKELKKRKMMKLHLFSCWYGIHFLWLIRRCKRYVIMLMLNSFPCLYDNEFFYELRLLAISNNCFHCNMPIFTHIWNFSDRPIIRKLLQRDGCRWWGGKCHMKSEFWNFIKSLTLV